MAATVPGWYESLKVSQSLPSPPTVIASTSPWPLIVGKGNSLKLPFVSMRPRRPSSPPYHRKPSFPSMIRPGELLTVYTVLVPEVVILPICWLPVSENHKLPSGPAAIQAAWEPPEIKDSTASPVLGVKCPSLPSGVVYQRFLSGPTTRSRPPLGVGNSLTWPDAVTRPRLGVLYSVNQTLSSGPSIMT